MSLTPQITLTATLDTISGVAAGNAANPARLRIALCGYGQTLPAVPGTANIALVGPTEYFSTGSPLSIPLWGNDVIAPSGTFYEIAVLDGNENVVQCGSYVFTGSGTIDLSNANQIIPGGITVEYLPCTGVVPGTVYTAPGKIIQLFVNGNAQRPGIDYNLDSTQTIATLTYSTQIQNGVPDTVYALCLVVAPGPPQTALAYTVCLGAVPGSVYTAPGDVVTVFYNGDALRPGAAPNGDFTGVGTPNIVLNFNTQIGDTVYALYFT